MEDVQDRIIAYLTGDSTEEESREVNEWIRASKENANEFAKISLLHGQLRNLLGGEFNAKETGILDDEILDRKVQGGDVEPADYRQEENKNNKRTRQHNHTIAIVSSISLLVLVALGIYFGLPGNNATRTAHAEHFATIRQLSNVVWSGNSFDQHQRVGVQTIELKSGILSLEFDNGVDVTLEGPATYELVSIDETKLKSGILVANVPSGAEGFRVDTPSAQVIDLGTSFGVNVEEGGAADVSVFDGEVEVVTGGTHSAKRISEGQTVRLGVSGEVQPTEFKINQFQRLWPIASGIVGSSDSIQFIPPWPKRIRRITSDDQIFLVPESHATWLSEPLQVNITEPGTYSDSEKLTPGELEKDKRIRSYLLHYAPDQELGPRFAKRVSGEITFDQPIVGVIVLQDELVASSHLSRRQADEAQRRRHLELDKSISGDQLMLSEDRRTLKVELIAPGRSTDMIRVIVDARERIPGLREIRRGERKKERRRKF